MNIREIMGNETYDAFGMDPRAAIGAVDVGINPESVLPQDHPFYEAYVESRTTSTITEAPATRAIREATDARKTSRTAHMANGFGQAPTPNGHIQTK